MPTTCCTISLSRSKRRPRSRPAVERAGARFGGHPRRLNADWLARVDRILNALDLARSRADMDLPGFRLHPLKGDYKGFYSVDVSGNWRIVFRFEGADTTDIDLIDYH